MNILQRFTSWLLSFDVIRKIFVRTKPEKKKPSKPIYCAICNKRVALLNDFKCPYCKKYHCEEHRLPEKHKCKGKPTAKGLGPKPTPESLKHGK